MNTYVTITISIVVGLLLIWIAWGWYANKVERPADTILLQSGDVQIRRTPVSIYATVSVSGPANTAPSRAFGILGGYIFGKNKTQESIKMTSPVISQPQSTTIKMTAPVVSTTQDDVSNVSFIMPSEYTLDTLPLPQDQRIKISKVLSKTIAAIRFNGYVNDDKRVAKYREQLFATLQKLTIKPISDITIAQYNDPYTPWFMRTNEIWVEVEYNE